MESAGRLGVLDAGVVAGGHVLGAKLTRLDQQRVEFDELVAADAGIRRAAAGVGLDEILDDFVLEDLAEVQDVVGDVELVGDAPSVLDRAQRTAGIFALDLGHVGQIGPHVQRDADHVIPVLLEQGRRNGAIDSARHAHNHARHQWDSNGRLSSCPQCSLNSSC